MSQPQLQKHPKKTIKRTLYVVSILLIVSVGYFFFRHDPTTPPPLNGYLTVDVPTNDSACIGKMYDDGVLKGDGMTNYKIYTSYDSIRKISGFDNIGELELAIKKTLNASASIYNSGLTVTAIDSLVIYSVEDYSTLPALKDGALVVSAAIAVKKISLSSAKSSGGKIWLDSVKKIFKNASLSIDNSDSSIKFGKGLVTYVKVIHVKKDTSFTYQATWDGESTEISDTYFKSKDFLAFSNPMNEAINYGIDGAAAKAVACLKITILSRALDNKKDSIFFSPMASQILVNGRSGDTSIISSTYLYAQIDKFSSRVPRSILNGMDNSKIYKYLILIDSATATLDDRKTKSFLRGKTLVCPIIQSKGKLRLFLDVWNYNTHNP